MADAIKPKIMVFCDHYLPSTQSGGGMWTIVRLVERFASVFDFYIVCRNYDSKTLREPFANVESDEWNELGNAKVFYCSPAGLKSKVFARLIADVKPQAIFLNSVFSTVVIKLLYARRRGLVQNINVVLAPCGETAREALAIKSGKKQIYLTAAKGLGLYRDLIWKASFDAEKGEIKSLFGDRIEIMVAPDLTPETILPDYDQTKKANKEPGAAKFIFVSRISKKKNIKFLLEMMLELRTGNVELEIVGPLEDEAYWTECRELIKKLPDNISVNVTGGLSQPAALDRLFDSHFFVLPTLNENFGYVFIESLAAGTPIIVSDRTIWNDIDENNVGFELSLDERGKWVDALNKCISMSNEEFAKMSMAARQYALNWLNDKEMLEANERVLRRATNT